MTRRNNNPNQFKLFMTGTEWENQLTHSTDGPLLPKMAEAREQSMAPGPVSTLNPVHGGGLYDAISKHGYQHDRDDPPTILLEDSPSGKSTRFVQSEGHHRVATSAYIERNTGKPVDIPTNYVDNTRPRRVDYRSYEG